MKITVRYQSRGGNNKEVALTIAKAVNSGAETIRVPIEEPVDVLFIGGGVYLGRIHPSLITFIEKLDPQKVKSVAVFRAPEVLIKQKKSPP
jgi:flavodoxin